jgi:prepilin-type N-terminal cleavage/methylation domain-containing protein
LAELARQEEGFTLIEILIAVMLLTVAIMAVLSVLDSSRSLVSVSEKNQTASHRAEQELERVAALPYSQIALASAPTSSLDPSSPNYYVGPGNTYQWDPSDSTKVENLRIAAGGVPPSTNWNDSQSRISGTTFDYVTDFYDPKLVSSPDQPDGRRITVAVTVNGKGLKKPVRTSTLVMDPSSP